MRTKTLLLSAAALVAGLATSQAQVYSQNVVGYATITLNPGVAGGYDLIAPSLDVDGTGTNGTIQSVLGTNCSNGTAVLVWNGVGFDTLTYSTRGTPAWKLGTTADPTYPLNAGEGFFIVDNVDSQITVSGNVLQAQNVQGGTLVNNYVSATSGAYNLISDQVPLSGGITSVLGYPAHNADKVLLWDLGTGGYDTYTYSTRGTPAWKLGTNVQEPQISVGQSFWLITGAASETWNQTFNVP